MNYEKLKNQDQDSVFFGGTEFLEANDKALITEQKLKELEDEAEQTLKDLDASQGELLALSKKRETLQKQLDNILDFKNKMGIKD